MPITVAETVSTSGTSSSTILSSWSPAANDLILVCMAARATNRLPTISGHGLTWTTVAYTSQSANACAVGIYAAFTTATPTAGTILVSLSANPVGAGVVVCAQRYSGVSLTTQIEASGITVGTTSSSMLGNVTTITASAWVVAAGCVRSTAALTLPAEETAFTINVTAGAGTGLITGHTWNQNPIATSTTVQMGTTADLDSTVGWVMVLVAIQPTAAAGGGAVFTWVPAGGIWPLSIWEAR